MHGPRIEEILKMQNTCFAEYEKFGVPKFEMINNVLIEDQCSYHSLEAQ